MTVAPKAKAGTPAKEPPNLPTAVRLTFGSFEEGGQLRFSLMWLDLKKYIHQMFDFYGKLSTLEVQRPFSYRFRFPPKLV